MATHTWTSSLTFCSTETHRTQATCSDCDTSQACQGCGGIIPAGQPHRICKQNGEAVHPGCESAATRRWGQGNW